jgi:hypothetical protein
VTTTRAIQGDSPALRRRLAIRGGVEAGLVGAATLLLIRILVASLFALAVAPFHALVRAYLYVFSATPGDSWLMRLAHSPVWLALKVGAYPFLGPRVLEPGFDLPVILVSVVTQVASSIGWGVLLGLATVGRAATTALPFGLLLGMAAWYVNGYLLPSFFAGGSLAAGPELLVEFVPFGLTMAVSFVHYEHAHGLATGHHAATHRPLRHLVEKPAR